MENTINAFSEAASEIQTQTLESFIHDEENGLDYELAGDYYLPLLIPPKSPKLGTFGKALFRYFYLRTENKTLFDGLMLSGKLNEYLENIDLQAEEMFEKLVKQLAEQECVTEQLKANNQMLWVQKMNNIHDRATEIVNAELIHG